MAIHPNAAREIDAYFKTLPEFSRKICERIRELIHRADSRIVEDWKWGPNFNKDGMICGLRAAKAFVNLTFFKGTLLKDPKKILAGCSEANARNKSVKFTSLDDIDEKTLIAYIQEAVKLNESGVKAPATRAPLKMPPDLKKALSAKKKAAAHFDALTPGYQREYIEWVLQAKRPETRADRIAKTARLCSEGRKLNDKYNG